MEIKEIIKDTYDSIADKYCDKYFSDKEDVKYYQKFLTYVDKGKLLDLGCGNGQVSNFFSRNGFECIGYDLSQKMIDAGLKINPNLNLQCADISDIPDQINQADCAIYAYSLFHLSKKQAIKSLQSCCKNLKNFGYIMLILKEGDKEEIHAEALNPNKNIFIKYYQPDEITNMLNETGFKVIEILSYTQDDNFSAGSGNKIMCVIAQKV